MQLKFVIVSFDGDYSTVTVLWVSKYIVSLKHELFHCFYVLFISLEMNVHYLENEFTLKFDHYTNFSVENGIFPS